MITTIISVILVILGAICNAIMDKITHHWDKSIFDKNQGTITEYDFWWNPDYSWINKYTDRNPKKPIKKIFFGLFDKPFTDAWHTFKSLMVVFLLGAITIQLLSTYLFTTILDYLLLVGIFIGLGIIWNLVFNLFYNKLLKRKD